MDKQTDLISRLQDEADLCRSDGASDIAALLDEAVEALRAHGIPALRLAEGFPEWKAAGLPVQVNGEESR